MAKVVQNLWSLYLDGCLDSLEVRAPLALFAFGWEKPPEGFVKVQEFRGDKYHFGGITFFTTSVLLEHQTQEEKDALMKLTESES